MVQRVETVDNLLVSFRRDLRSQQRSARTISMYLYAVNQFLLHLDIPASEATVDVFTRENLKDWVYESSEKWMPNTINTHFTGVSRFAKWLVDEDYLEDDPSKRIPLPVEKDTAPEVLSDEELAALLKGCSGKDFQARRDTAILRVLLDTGVRVSELVSMTLEGTDLDEEKTVITGKGGKVRIIYFSSRTVSALDRYVRVRSSHKYAKVGELWLTQRGKMTTNGVRTMLVKLGNRSGVTGLHPHRFRHTWAHDHLLNDTSTVDLKRLAGWSSEKMLSRYGASGADVRAEQAARRQARGDRV